MPFGQLLNLYFVGLFINNFFPSTIGGDVFRGYEVGRDVGDRALAMASVFMERFTGMTALTAIALVAFVSNLSSFRDPALRPGPGCRPGSSTSPSRSRSSSPVPWRGVCAASPAACRGG